MIQTTYDHLTPFGLLRMHLVDDELVSMYFMEGSPAYPGHPTLSQKIDDYFSKKTPIVWPVRFVEGTQFQKKVWQELLKIPLGSLRSYAQVARAIGHPTAYRAVGQACKRNPIGLVVPCHRVVGSDGSLTGYSGKNHVDLKGKLINHEIFEFKGPSTLI